MSDSLHLAAPPLEQAWSRALQTHETAVTDLIIKSIALGGLACKGSLTQAGACSPSHCCACLCESSALPLFPLAVLSDHFPQEPAGPPMHIAPLPPEAALLTWSPCLQP